jgi:hypothetical protein
MALGEMGPMELWEEKCIGRIDLISTWCGVLIVPVTMLFATSMASVRSCQSDVAVAGCSTTPGSS